MWYAIGIFVGLVVAVVLLRAAMRRYGGPSTFAHDRIEEGVKLIQEAAMRNIRQADGEKPAPLDGGKFPDQVFVLDQVLRFTYSIESTPDEFHHVLTSKLVGKRTTDYQVQSTLVAMMYMTRQLADCGISEEDVKFDEGDYGSGEDYICMHLTANQQDQFRLFLLAKHGS